MKRSKLTYGLIAVICALLLFGAGFWLNTSKDDSSNDGDNDNPSGMMSGPNMMNGNGTGNNQGNNQAGNQQSRTYAVVVYFSKHPDSDNDPSKVFPVARISSDLGVAKYAIGQVIQGPTAAETAQGYFSTVQLRSAAGNCGNADYTVSIMGGTAKLQFCKPFDHRGVVADGQADSELKATLKQFSSVNKVIILNSAGNCEFNLSGQNLCLK